MALGPLEAPILTTFQAGLDGVPLDREIEITRVDVEGRPNGTALAVRNGFLELADAGVLAVVGPGITDNAFIARDLADAVELPCINWSGNEQTRSEWCFQFQVGSL